VRRVLLGLVLALACGCGSTGTVESGQDNSNAGDPAAAQDDFDLAIERDPHEPEAWFGRGNARRAQGDLDGARADYGETLRLDPSHSGAQRMLEWLEQARQAREDAAAEEALREAESSSPEDR